MPRLSVWFIRASLVYLGLGFTLGAFMLADEGLSMMPDAARLLPAHMEFLMIGWLLQLALGVAYWILPRFVQGPPRGNEAMTWVSLFLINGGVWLVAASTLLPFTWLVPAGRTLEIVSALAFLWVAWRRVRPSK